MTSGPRTASAGLGTFGGVFTPSLLTILGIVLFLRMGFVTGALGGGGALLTIAIAHAISIATSLSVAAVATNLRVKGGGDYYLISRTLGIGFGGAIGVVLFLAQSIAVGFYCIGFSEAAIGLVGSHDPWLLRVVGLVAATALLGLAWLGADWATRLQYLIMALLVAALIAFFAGAWPAWSSTRFAENFGAPPHAVAFWAGFAIFFPAVTGFTQGISMSGDLRDPARSIPRGTLTAVLVALVVYVAATVVFTGAASAQQLVADNLAMKRLSASSLLFNCGVFAATLSSALASFLGAPRILQAMAQDRVLPLLQPFAVGYGPAGNPRRAVLLTAVIAAAVIAGGSLNTVAHVVSMFFLLSYALLNYATWFEARAASPAFRPTFRFYSRHVSLAAAVGCLGVMLAIDPVAALIAGVVAFALHQYVRLHADPARWADSRRSHHLQRVREHLLAAGAEAETSRDWRPQILVFSDSALRRARILDFASWVAGGAGLVTVVKIVETLGVPATGKRAEALQSLKDELARRESNVFPLVVVAPRLDDAVPVILQSSGIGPVQANTVIVNWMDESSFLRPFAARRYGRNLSTAFRLGCNLLVLDADAAQWKSLEDIDSTDRRIDIWWADGASSELALLLAHLMQRSSDWAGATVRLLALSSEASGRAARMEQMTERLKNMRIEAQVEIIDDGDKSSLLAASRDASMVFVPCAIHAERFYHRYGGSVEELIDAPPIMVLTLAAQDVDLEGDPDRADEKKPAVDPP